MCLYIGRGPNNIHSSYPTNLFLIGVIMWNIQILGNFLCPMVESDNVFCGGHFSIDGFFTKSPFMLLFSVSRCLWIDLTNHGCKTPLPTLCEWKLQEVSRLTFPLWYQNKKNNPIDFWQKVSPTSNLNQSSKSFIRWELMRRGPDDCTVKMFCLSTSNTDPSKTQSRLMS